jgi:pyruvyl transferase EpsO
VTRTGAGSPDTWAPADAIENGGVIAEGPHLALIAALGARIDQALLGLIDASRPYALLDFPHTPNVGDSVIWLGEIAWLRRRGYSVPRYTCSNLTYSAEGLRRRIGNGTILLSGGGNFGDLYESHQRMRELVVTAFPDNPIVQLPQTIHFESTGNLRRARRIFDSHPNLTLLVRDRRSLDLARNEFRAQTVLCPDMAFALGPLPRSGEPETDVVWLSRQDKESAGDTPAVAPPGVMRVEWLEESNAPIVHFSRMLRRQLRHRPSLRRLLQDALSRTYLPLARDRFERGVRLLSRGRCVVTDRLHGHILATLLGIPHLILDNGYGKVREFHRAWTADCPTGVWCDSAAEALDLAVARAARIRRAGG